MIFTRIQQLDKSLWLRDGNYQTWKGFIACILEQEKTWGFTQSLGISTGLGRLLSNTMRREMDARARNTIKMNVDPSQLPLIVNCVTSAQMWETLRDRHEIQSIYRSGMLRDELLDGPKKGESVENFLTRLTDIRNQLRAIGEVTSDREEMVAIIRGLPPVYEGFKMQHHPNMTLTELRSYVFTQEQRMAKDKERSSKSTAAETARVATSAISTGGPRNRRKKAKGINHAEWLKNITCHKCDEKGHIAKYCPQKGGQKESAKVASSTGKVAWACVAAVVGRKNVHRTGVDSGASSHMVGDLSLLENPKRIDPIPIAIATEGDDE